MVGNVFSALTAAVGTAGKICGRCNSKNALSLSLTTSCMPVHMLGNVFSAFTAALGAADIVL